MTRKRTPGDLRERMQRVAARSRRPPESAPRRPPARPADTEGADVDVASARHADVVSAREVGDARARQPGAGPARRSRAAPELGARRTQELPITEPRSRLETLLAWGMWELTVVPGQRWQWFMTTIRTGDTQAHERKRGD